MDETFNVIESRFHMDENFHVIESRFLMVQDTDGQRV